MSENKSNDEMSDSDFLTNCEKEFCSGPSYVIQASKEQCAEKRKKREDENSEEEGFTTVTRRKPKRLIRSESYDTQNLEKNTESGQEASYDVCITSLENLPKQIAMAKLLRAENIKDITKIKYKSSYKVIIQFKNKQEAIKLVKCQKLKEQGLRCQMTQELALSYGVMKGVDLDLKEDELLEIIKCETELISIKRLKRLNMDGKWIDSESIRICFKNNILPTYVYIYDCRFKIEPYVFPVTQCSGCWEFGHILKYCPTKKILCPKCGGNHENCDTKIFKCLNCKGNHLVLDKKCPLFLKEKVIRKIMSEEQITYRRALQKLMEKSQTQDNYLKERRQHLFITPSSNDPGNRVTYSNTVTRALVHQQEQQISQHTEEPTSENETTVETQRNKRTRKKTQKQNSAQLQDQCYEEESFENEETNSTKNKREERGGGSVYRFEFKMFLSKLKQVFMAKCNFEEKV